jgi:hypothetical protein
MNLQSRDDARDFPSERNEAIIIIQVSCGCFCSLDGSTGLFVSSCRTQIYTKVTRISEGLLEGKVAAPV